MFHVGFGVLTALSMKGGLLSSETCWLDEAEERAAIQQEVTTWLVESGDENYFNSYMVLDLCL
jgi:hypothetical protein